MTKQENLLHDTRGDAVVEATILFPILMMIFAGLVLLAMYLPTRASLQRATQYAATAIATERSDTWLRCDPETLEYYWIDDKDDLGNVYGSVLGALKGNNRDEQDNAEQMVIHMAGKSVFQPAGELTVSYGVVNYVIYKEVVITATQIIPVPVDLSFVGFPTEIPITVTSTAVVQNGDEFVRNMDIAYDLAVYFSDKLGLDEMFGKVGELAGRWNNFLGI